MTYRVIGLMSGSSLDGLDIAFVELNVSGANWTFEIVAADTYAYSEEWAKKLRTATQLSALDYQLLHTAYGRHIGEQVLKFIDAHSLHYKVALIASHGHTTFHIPAQKMTAQLGDGAAIAAVTGLPVISDLRAMDVALGGQGAPIVPMGEKLLFADYNYLLNIGGIANLSIKNENGYTAFDICPANRVLNMLAAEAGKEYDAGGAMAAQGEVDDDLLQQLNALEYYAQPAPKSLANDFGTEAIYPLIKSFGLAITDNLRTYVAHIVHQIKSSITNPQLQTPNSKLLITGGGAFNHFLVQQLQEALLPLNIEVVVPEEKIVQYKEALIMALLGVLRWRQEVTTLSSVTGASRDAVGGAVWLGE